MLPQIAQMGVKTLVLCGAGKVDASYFRSHVLDLRNLRANLAVGLAQVQDDSVPRILLAPNFQELLAGGGLLDQTFPREQVSRVVAHPAVNTSSLESVGEMLLAIGPEAGWEESELEMFWAAGFAAASLGPRILRSDVAAVAPWQPRYCQRVLQRAISVYGAETVRAICNSCMGRPTPA
ncbi:unnamed protein product [Effrenium voratum]|uniref:16S rRNA (uracil(1498)-N(3))-methyltransferase n=1 Tax=Effrenium voratum TaxID=2562239 RepID=A0AA36JPB3_9DINO|nr:unnamed protein product [Effrenium voratum]